MEEGFIPELRAGKPSEWFEGSVERSFWFGIKTVDKTHREIRTYRCTSCGYLESYAD
jgi:hypothetical protein